MANAFASRRVERLVRGRLSQDGNGVRILRLHDFGGGLDPFLMLDELGSGLPGDHAGACPLHPHRGIQTLSYLLHGTLTHRDHRGHSDTLQAGGAQWVHAGRGVIHAETPLADARGLRGFQLWLNLPARDKLSQAVQRSVGRDEMPHLERRDATLIALGGEWRSDDGQGIEGPLDALAGRGAVAHVRLGAGGELALETPQPTLLVYVFDGEVVVGGTAVAQGTLARLGGGERLALCSVAGGQALLLAGSPHREPIAHYGPFVMNEQAELERALRDYRDGTLVGDDESALAAREDSTKVWS